MLPENKEINSDQGEGPQKDQVVWWGYLNPKSGSPTSILGSLATIL